MRSIASRMSVMSGEGALSVFARARELERQGRSIIHLELGEPDFHPGPSVIHSAAKALAEAETAIVRWPEFPRFAKKSLPTSSAHAILKYRPKTL